MSLAFSNFKPAFKKGYISLLKILKLISFLPSSPPHFTHPSFTNIYKHLLCTKLGSFYKRQVPDLIDFKELWRRQEMRSYTNKQGKHRL